MSFLLLPLVVAGVLGAWYFARHRDPGARAGFLRRCAFWLMAFVTAFFALFVVGETISDPGGWQAAALIAAWALPLLALSGLAWFRPDLARPVLIACTAAVVGLSVWAALAAHWWGSFEDRNGPVRVIVAFVLAAALAVFGLRRTRLAGLLLVILGVIPLALSSVSGLRGGSLSAAMTPSLIAGVLYLLAAATDPRPPEIPARAPHRLRVG